MSECTLMYLLSGVRRTMGVLALNSRGGSYTAWHFVRGYNYHVDKASLKGRN